MKIKHLFILTLFPCLCLAQDFSENWTGFFSYFNIQDISQTDTEIYAAADNAVLIYNVVTNEVETLSSIDGLSGEPISAIHYSEAFQTLFIGYENGLLEVIQDNSSSIISDVGIVEEVSISPDDKRINHIYEYQDRLFISTGFGIVEYSLSNLEFGDTFRIGDNGEELNITQTTVNNTIIYASTLMGGLRAANVNSDNLIDFNEWQVINGGSYDTVGSIGDDVYTTNTSSRLFRVVNNTLQEIENLGRRATAMQVSQNTMTITTRDVVRVYDAQFNRLETVTTIQDINRRYKTATYINNQLYIGHIQSGLLQISPAATPTAQMLSPDGPLLNSIFDIEATSNELWVTFGEYDIFFNPFPKSRLGLSHLDNEEWINFSFQDINGLEDIVEVSINPQNSEEVYISSYGQGLGKIVDNTLVEVFDTSNSTLNDFNPDTTDGTRVNGTAFDAQGNLYITETFSEDALHVLDPNGNFTALEIGDQFPAVSGTSASEITIDQSGNVYFGTATQGLLGYQPSTGVAAQLRGDAGGAGLPDDNIQALEIDLSGRLWIGSTTGLRVLFGPQRIFSEPNVTVDPIIIEENGVAQELLFSQFVSDIEVDGSNNKWVATAASGVFYLSPNGQETLLRFTKENSPLPSNNISDISIDEATGRVYIATTNGLLAYNSTATSPEDDLESVRAYPNPVRPNFTGNVVIDGLTANANVKITDITGNLVHEDTSVGGTIEWDTTAFGRHKVASGVYLILITSEDATQTQVHKLLIVR